MIHSSTATLSGPVWSKVPHSRDYELRYNGQVWGRLKKPSFWSSEYLAETPHGSWTFRRTGFFRMQAEIAETATRNQVAIFRYAWGNGGTLTFADGQTFRLSCKGCFRPVWTLTNDQNEAVLFLHRRQKNFELPKTASLSQARKTLLMLFTLYRVLQAEEDASAALIAAS